MKVSRNLHPWWQLFKKAALSHKITTPKAVASGSKHWGGVEGIGREGTGLLLSASVGGQGRVFSKEPFLNSLK